MKFVCYYAEEDTYSLWNVSFPFAKPVEVSDEALIKKCEALSDRFGVAATPQEAGEIARAAYTALCPDAETEERGSSEEEDQPVEDSAYEAPPVLAASAQPRRRGRPPKNRD